MISLISFISVSGVALGVASLIVVLSIMNGFDAEIKNKIIGTYAHVIVTKRDGITDPEAIVKQIKAVQGVTNAAGFISGQAILKKDKSVTGILVKGVDLKKESSVSQVLGYAANGIDKLSGDTVILGSEMMKSDDIAVGDTVELLIPYSFTDIEKAKLKVVGSFTSGRYDYDANMAVINLETAQRLFRIKNTVTSIGIKVNDEMAVENVKYMLEGMFPYPFVVKTWMDLDKNLVKALALEKKMMFIILALIVMVACFNIAGSLIMVVMEKTKDIGILKAIGANSRGISLVFLMQGAFIGFFGIIIGGAAGIFLANNVNQAAGFIEKVTGVTIFPNDVYYFTEIPSKINPSDVGFVIIVAFVLTLLAGIYPSWKAARLDPVEAIRYE